MIREAPQMNSPQIQRGNTGRNEGDRRIIKRGNSINKRYK